MAYRVGVVGAAGYAGVELVRLLIAHPDFELVAITSNADAGPPLADLYPAFAGVGSCVASGACSADDSHGAAGSGAGAGAGTPPSPLTFTTHDDPVLTTCDIVFLAVPHTAALAQAPKLLAHGVTVIDLSADYRLDDPAVYEAWYGVPHTSPELLRERAFGLPELESDGLARVRDAHAAGKAVLVACAGCYPTATSLAAAPAIRAGFVREASPVVVDAISGVTGAGKTPSARTHFCHADSNLEAYNVCRHRHTPEIEQILGTPQRVVFTPHLAPLRRGLLSTVTLQLADEVRGSLDTDKLVERYRAFYAGRPFVRVLDAGQCPQTSSVVGTNMCHVGVALDERCGVIVAMGAIDNLCKGAAGQAVQCANIVLGLDERRGLTNLACPV